jgi:bifunctional non-homologous end joining protein LigD
LIIDGEAVVIGPDGLSLFAKLRRSECARAAVLYAFDLIEKDGGDLRELPFLARKKALARLLRGATGGILLNEHSGRRRARFRARLQAGFEGIVSKRIDAPYRSGRHSAWIKVRNPASIAVQRDRSENWNGVMRMNDPGVASP